jgi:hypothetical protein
MTNLIFNCILWTNFLYPHIVKGYFVDVKKALAAQERNIEKAAIEFQNAYLRHNAVFTKFQQEAQKYLGPPVKEDKAVDSPVEQAPFHNNSPRK